MMPSADKEGNKMTTQNVGELMRLKSHYLELNFKGKQTAEEKLNYLAEKYKEVLLDNTYSKVAYDELKEYAEHLEEVVDYLLGIRDYQSISEKARRVMMFLLSCTATWYCKDEDMLNGRKKNVEKAMKLVCADVLPEFRRQVIKDFLEKNKFIMRELTDYDKQVLCNPNLNETVCMYHLGLPYSFVVEYRKKHLNHGDDGGE